MARTPVTVPPPITSTSSRPSSLASCCRCRCSPRHGYLARLSSQAPCDRWSTADPSQEEEVRVGSTGGQHEGQLSPAAPGDSFSLLMTIHACQQSASVTNQITFVLLKPCSLSCNEIASEWCLTIDSAQIGARRVHVVRVRGGNKKYRALRLDHGNFAWASEGEWLLLQQGAH